MCGIFGAVFVPSDELDARAALDAIRHRGPDSDGLWSRGDVTLGHTRLAIIDLTPAGAQPMANDDGNVHVVFNGEIYNHHALRRELEARGRTFRSRSDTEVIVRGYEEWGDRIIEKLDGMFAIAIWDSARSSLLLARDRSGKKPLFYAPWRGGWVFGSEMSAIHAAGVPQSIDVTKLPHYLSCGYVPAPLTLHDGVAQLLPAHRMTVRRGEAPRQTAYWTPRFGEDLFRGSYAEARDQVRALTIAAVERRLESDVPLGAFLSGGIDSTIIVGVMAKLLGKRVNTFSIGFSGDARFDETAFAKIAADSFGTNHTVHTLEPSSFDLIEKLVRHHDGPFGDVSAIPTSVVARIAREHVTVALTGDGGDELFCGYERFLAAELSEAIPAPLRALSGALVGVLPGAAAEKSLLTKAKRFLSAWSLPLADRMARWNSFFFDPTTLLRRDVAAQLGAGVEAPLVWQREIFDQAHGETTLSRVLQHNFQSYLPYDLLVKADRTSMAHGLETRSPFLDTALIEFAARLPPSFLRRGTFMKRILKEAFVDVLPPQILTRGKMGFGVPLGTWFRKQLRAPLHDYLGPSARVMQYLDEAAVTRLLTEHDGSIADHGQKLWSLLTLEVWLRQMAAGAGTANAA